MDNIQQPKGTASINYSALFTGEALLKPEIVNPNREELIEIKDLQNIADSISEPNYKITTKDGKEFTVLEFLLSFNPNNNFKGGVPKGQSFKDKVIVSYRLLTSKDKVFSKDGSKIQVIDQHNLSSYIPYIEGLSVAEMLDNYEKTLRDVNAHEYVVTLISSMCRESVRHACVGEVALYSLLHSFSVLSPHNVRKVNGEPVPLNGFVLKSDISPDKAAKAFEEVVDGDFSVIRKVMDSPICKFEDGATSEVYGLLGVSKYNGKYRQEVYSSLNESSVVSEMTKEKDHPVYGKSHLNSQIVKRLTDVQYGWDCNWNNSFEFQVFDESKDVDAVNSVQSDEDDDLPF